MSIPPIRHLRYSQSDRRPHQMEWGLIENEENNHKSQNTGCLPCSEGCEQPLPAPNSAVLNESLAGDPTEEV